MTGLNIFTVGGTVQANEQGLYISRRADGELLALCRDATFAYVLTPRQMGKSSLMIRTAEQLMEEDILPVIIDLQRIGIQVTADEWYRGLLTEISEQLRLNAQVEQWWKEHDYLGITHRLTRFFETVVLEEIQDQVVVFVDEVDTTLSLEFTDDFFVAIRSLYSTRASQPKFRRLSFVLIGVATPGDLIRDPKRTPFNIGQAVNLNGFRLDEVEPLEKGLEGLGNSRILMQAILDWTAGQPFLTQKICKIAQESGINFLSGEEVIQVRNLVQNNIIDNWESQDNPSHLRVIRDYLLDDNQRVNRILGLYCQILEQNDVITTNIPSEVKLLLSGLVAKQQGKLRVHNNIYSCIFNANWVEKAQSNLRPYSEAFNAWIESDRQDESRLLRGEALKEALKWSRDRILSPLDTAFLQISQENALKTEKEKRAILVRAKKKAEKWIRKAKKFIGLGFLIFVVTLIAVFLLWLRFERETLVTTLERNGANTLQEFNLAPLKALDSAVINGRALEQLQGDLMISKYSATNPILALQTIVDNIAEVNEINTYQTGVSSVIFIQKEERIVTAGKDGTIRIWEAKSGKQLDEILAHPSGVNSVRFSEKNPSRFITAGADGIVKQWSLSQSNKLPEKPIGKPINHGSSIRNVRYSPNEQLIATSGEIDGKLKLWNLQGELIWEIVAHDKQDSKELGKGIKSLNFSADGKKIITGGKDGTAKLWDLKRNLLQTFRHIDSVSSGEVNSATFSDQSKSCQNDKKDSISCQMIATSGDDGTVKLWNLQGKLLKIINAHIGKVEASRFSPNNLQLATSSSNDATSPNESSVRIWNLDTGELLSEFKGHQGSVESIRYNQNGTYLATAGKDDGKVIVWKIPETPIYKIEEQHQGQVNSVRFSPDGKQIASAGDDGKVRLWNLIIKPGVKPDLQPSATLKDDTYQKKLKFQSLRFSPNGDELAVGGDDGKIRLWNLKDNSLFSFPTGQVTVESVNFDSKGDQIASAGDGKVAMLWDLKGNLKKKFSLGNNLSGSSRTYGVRFSLDDNMLAVVGDDGIAVLFDIVTGHSPVKLEGHKGTVYAVGFNPDGKSLVTGGDDGTIRQWDFKGNELRRFKTYQGIVRNISFSDDGELLATAGSGGTVKLWNLKGRQLANFKGHRGIVRSLNFSKDGKLLVSAGDDSRPKIWPIRKLSVLLDEGCEKLKDYVNSPESRISCPKNKRLPPSLSSSASLWQSIHNAIATFFAQPNSQEFFSGSDASAKRKP